MPDEKVSGSGAVSESGQATTVTKKTSEKDEIYIISGVIILVVLVAIAVCVRHKKKYSYAHRQIDAGQAEQYAQIADEADN